MKIYDPWNHGQWINDFEPSSFEDSKIVVLRGGSDIHPSYYSHTPIEGCYYDLEADAEEYELLQKAIRANKLIVGICKGGQWINVAAGGWLIQDVSNHEGHHEIQTYDGKTFLVNSSHHQMCYPYNLIPDEEYELLGWAEGVSSRYFIQGNLNLDVDDFAPLCPESLTTDNKFKEPEVVWYPQIRGLAIQSHAEWSSSPANFNQWLNDEIRTSLAICLNTK